ncbi:MAG TPA: recombination mediator RecR [Gemmataceae bacterium]|nr:recombination mediator RecR [Gemmataceae bacterium]
MTTNAIQRLIDEFSQLPGIGPKTAERLTHYLLASDRKQALTLAAALNDLVEKIHPCRQCFNLTEGEICSICTDPRRDQATICVVEYPRDLALFERIGTYKGVYHVLQGRLAPLDNVGPEQLTLDALARRVRGGGVNEVILATSPTLEGDGTALFASNLLAGTGVKITRLARGLPSGSSLELANTQMLLDALEGRRAF